MYFGSTHVVYRRPPRATRAASRPPGRSSAPAAIPLTETQRKLLIALCRPIVESSSATPATNPQIAAEVHLSVDAVKAHMRHLFERFGSAICRRTRSASSWSTIVLGVGPARAARLLGVARD